MSYPTTAGAQGRWGLRDVYRARMGGDWPLQPPPVWLPLADGAVPDPFSDFTTEGGTNHYYTAGAQQANLAALLAALGGSYARTSGKYGESIAGALQWFATGVAATTDRGISLEGARTNLFLQSTALSTAPWQDGGTGASVATGVAGAPDGTSTMATITYGSAGQWIQTGMSFVNAANYRASVWARVAAATKKFRAKMNDGVSNTSSADFIAATTLARFDASLLATNTTGAGFAGIINGSDNVAGDVIAWGPQLELGLFPSSYIPTTSAAATRDADLLTRPRTSPSAIAKMLIARTPPGVGTEQILWSADDGTVNNRLRATYKSDGHLHIVVTTGGVDQCDLDLGAVAVSTDFKIAFRLAANDFSASLNGAAVVTDVAGTMPAGVVNDRLGRGLTAGNEWFSTIKQDGEWPTATDTALRTLAT